MSSSKFSSLHCADLRIRKVGRNVIKYIFSHKNIFSAESSTASSRLLPTDQLLTNENSAALTGAALGLGIGVAGSLLVGKILEDAARCRPPAITRLLPLPDLRHLNTLVNPECEQRAQVQDTYRLTDYPTSYPSPGYDVVPLSRYSIITLP